MNPTQTAPPTEAGALSKEFKFERGSIYDVSAIVAWNQLENGTVNVFLRGGGCIQMRPWDFQRLMEHHAAFNLQAND